MQHLGEVGGGCVLDCCNTLDLLLCSELFLCSKVVEKINSKSRIYEAIYTTSFGFVFENVLFEFQVREISESSPTLLK